MLAHSHNINFVSIIFVLDKKGAVETAPGNLKYEKL